MTARVLRFRPRAYYAVTPDTADEEPVYYERTLDGLNSAIKHAELLTAGGGIRQVTLTEGRTTRVILEFEDGKDVTGTLLPPPYPAENRPEASQVRPGSPKGHIPEVCTHANHRKAGTRPRKNPNMPKAEWPGIIS